MSDEQNQSGLAVKPAKLPTMTTPEVKARAQRIVNLHGAPPYTAATVGFELNSDDEIAVISEFVTYWMPFCVLPKKEGG